MIDDVAEAVAHRVCAVVAELEEMGLRTASILRGMELALARLRNGAPPEND